MNDHGSVPAVDTEEIIEKPRASDNANLIETYRKAGASGSRHFDLRVKITSEGLQEALTWFHSKQNDITRGGDVCHYYAVIVLIGTAMGIL